MRSTASQDIWTAEGWLYLTVLKDLYTKQVVGYSLNKRMTAELVCDALSMAIRNQKPLKGLIQIEARNIAVQNQQLLGHQFLLRMDTYYLLTCLVSFYGVKWH